MRQVEKVPRKALQGCCAQMSHLPMASASMLVVATTSLVLALMNTCASTSLFQAMILVFIIDFAHSESRTVAFL